MGDSGDDKEGDSSMEQGQIQSEKLRSLNKQTELSDALQILRKAGHPKPAHVSWGDWAGPKKLSDRHELIALYRASGTNARTIAQRVGYTEGRLSLVLNCSRMKARVEEIRQQYYGNTVQAQFNAMVPSAISELDQILTSPLAKHASKLKAINEVLNRAIGKPKETIEVRSTSAKDIFDYLDKKRAEQRALDHAEATEHGEQLPNTVDQSKQSEDNITALTSEEAHTLSQEVDNEVDDWVARNLLKRD